MSVQTADYLDAATHLPPGGRLTFYDVGWDEYEQSLSWFWLLSSEYRDPAQLLRNNSLFLFCRRSFL